MEGREGGREEGREAGERGIHMSEQDQTSEKRSISTRFMELFIKHISSSL